MRNETEEVRPLHELYCAITDRQMDMSLSMTFAWLSWKAHGWGEPELRLVVDYIKGMIAKGRRYPESLRFNLLIMDADRFLYDLTDARAAARQPKVDHARASVLAATGRPTTEPTPDAKPVGEILSRLEIAERLRELRQSL